jgi:hypothetical protein
MMKRPTPKPTLRQINAVKASARREFDRFMSLSAADKTREAEAIAKAKSKPLSPAERAMFDEFGIGRP